MEVLYSTRIFVLRGGMLTGILIPKRQIPDLKASRIDEYVQVGMCYRRDIPSDNSFHKSMDPKYVITQ